MKPLRFGLIGAGAIAQTYVQALQLCETIKVVGVADIRSQAAKDVAALLHCESYRSFQEMVAKQKLDAAVVCTPPTTHADICIWLLKRDIHVLCEKPLAIDSASAEEMIEAADTAGVQLTMASKFRYVDDVVRAKSIVDSGVLGDILLFENCFTSRLAMGSRWNSDPAVSGGGVLIDNGTHSVDIMRYFFGPLADLQVVEGKRHQQLDVEDTVRVFVRTANGVMGSIDLSWSMNKEQPNFLSVFGSEGTLFVGWKESKFRRSLDPSWTRLGDGYNKVDAFKKQIENFAAAIEGREPLRITPQDSLASVEVIEAAYAALYQSQWQKVRNIQQNGAASLASAVS